MSDLRALDRSTKLMVALLALLVAVMVGIGVLYVQGAGIDSRTSDQAQIVHQLRAAETQRQCTTRAQSAAFAVILDLLADNFATPPYPDPDRQKAVDGLRSAAETFRAPAKACP